MRVRTAAEAQALGELCGNLVVLATAAYVVWSTIVAFDGGALPLVHVQVDGGVAFGVLWTFVVDPLIVSVSLLAAYVLVAVLTFLLRLIPRRPGIDLAAIEHLDRLEIDLEAEAEAGRGPALRGLRSTPAP